jgi:predicted permease
VVTLGVALAFSLPAALSATRFHLSVALREGGTSGTRARVRFRSLLVGAQVALSCVLLSATVLFGRALASMRGFDPGWNGDGVYVSTLDFQQSGTPRAVGAAQQREILARLSTNGNIEAAALATKLPEGGRSSFGSVVADGVRPPSGLPGFDAWVNRVSPGYLRAMRIPILRGRDIAATDDDRSERVAIVSASLANTLWGAGDPIGKRFFVVQPKQRLELRVIGVARDIEQRTRRLAVGNFYYVPAAQWYNPEVTLHIRGRPGHEAEAAAAIRPAVRAVNPALVVTTVRALDDAMNVFLLPQRLAAWVSAAMGTFGLLLAIVGIYGVTTFVLARRAREVAIRMALGATAGSVIRLLLRQSARAPMIGAAVGTVLAMVAAIAASKIVAGTRATDPVLILMPVLVATVVGAAMVAPIRRLVRASPMTNLRED